MPHKLGEYFAVALLDSPPKGGCHESCLQRLPIFNQRVALLRLCCFAAGTLAPCIALLAGIALLASMAALAGFAAVDRACGFALSGLQAVAQLGRVALA